MSERLRWFLARSCSLASLAYAARMKRLGRSYFADAVLALASIDGSEIVSGLGTMPSSVRSSSAI